MGLSRIDLVHRPLPKAFRGYQREAVDRLLQDLSDALGRVTDEKIALAATVADLEGKLKERLERESALQDALAAGQQLSEEMRSTAQKEAQLILETARVKADALLQNANARLARILEEAADAKKARARFEMDLRTVILGHLRLLEQGAKFSARVEEMRDGSPPATGEAAAPPAGARGKP